MFAWISSSADGIDAAAGTSTAAGFDDRDAMQAQIHALQSQNNILACRNEELNQRPEYVKDLEARVFALQDDRMRLCVEKGELESNVTAIAAQNEELKARRRMLGWYPRSTWLRARRQRSAMRASAHAQTRARPWSPPWGLAAGVQGPALQM